LENTNLESRGREESIMQKKNRQIPKFNFERCETTSSVRIGAWV